MARAALVPHTLHFAAGSPGAGSLVGMTLMHVLGRQHGASTGIAGMPKTRMNIGFFRLAEKRYQQKYRQISVHGLDASYEVGVAVDRPSEIPSRAGNATAIEIHIFLVRQPQPTRSLEQQGRELQGRAGNDEMKLREWKKRDVRPGAAADAGGRNSPTKIVPAL